MAMGPNDVNLIQVYAQEQGSPVQASAIQAGTDFDVVVEAEAGIALFNSQGGYRISVTVRDLTNNTDILVDDHQIDGQFANVPWDDQQEAFRFTVAAAETTGLEDHLLEIVASLIAGGGANLPPDVSFGRSGLIALY